MEVRYVELFAGVGGFRLGIERAYSGLGGDGEAGVRLSGGREAINGSGDDLPQAERSDGRTLTSPYPKAPKCVFASEWDKYAADTYEKNFGERPDTRDLATVPATDIPDHDLIVGGFPCQAFSVAGKRGGFSDTRGTLFFEIARIAQHHRTKYLFLENVKGLLSHESGKTFETILRTLDELGYDCQWQVLNSKDFGVPQNRERVFIIGHLRGEPRPQVFPLSPDSEADIVLPTLTARYYGAQANGGYIRHKDGDEGGAKILIEQYGEVRESDESPTIRTPSGGNRMPMIKFVGSLNPKSRKGTEGQEHLSRAHKQPARVHDAAGINPALSSGETQGRYHTLYAGQIRRLTPIECERLQGFPDNWTAGVSDTQRYKQMGNAVTVNVIEAIARRLLT